MWNHLTHAGDSAVMLPAALVIALAQVRRGNPAAGLSWLLLLGGGGLLVLSSKLAFIGWGIGIPALRFTGISGHSFLAAAVLPVLGQQLLQGRAARLAPYAGLAGGGLALLVGISRLMVGAHSVSEVAAGLALGLWVALSYLKLCDGMQALPLRRLLLAACMLVACGVLFGLQSPSHALVTQLALYLSGRLPPGGSW